MINYNIKIFNERLIKKKFSFYVLGADIGGTNTNVGIAGIDNSKPVLLFSLNFKSQELDSLITVINETLAYAKENYNITIKSSCIGAAGVVSSNHDFAILTNVSWDVNVTDLLKKTSLKKIFIINDFQAIGYGINLLDPNNQNDIFKIRGKKSLDDNSKSTKALIGAGTGLGKSILIYDEKYDTYTPIPSEGGHADFPTYNNFEMQLISFIKKLRKISKPVRYEDVISSRGLISIYEFIKSLKKFKSTKYIKEIDNSQDKTAFISKYKTADDICKETFRFYTQYYARCAKNFVLDTMAIDGLYIAGGIASKNKDIFNSNEFINEFENSFSRKEVLKEIPISIIVNYDVSLYGTCFAAMCYSQKKDKI